MTQFFIEVKNFSASSGPVNHSYVFL